MFDCFSEISQSWKSIARQVGCRYSDDPPKLEGFTQDDMAFWRPPVLAFAHRDWTITFTSSPYIPRLFLLPPTYAVFVNATISPKRQFDLTLKSTEPMDSFIDAILSPAEYLVTRSEKHADLMQRLFPVTLERARTNVIEIDLHFDVRSFNRDDPQIIFSSPSVREAFLATPKIGLRICGIVDTKTDLPSGLKLHHIGSMELLRPTDKERIMQIVRLYNSLLDRLSSLEFISSGPGD